MFILSKFAWLAAQPLSIVFLLAVAATIFILAGPRWLGGLAAAAASIVLFVMLYTTAGTVALQALENRTPKPDGDPDRVACMIVLGGAFENEVTTSRGGVEFNQAADRFVEALRL